MSNYHCFTSVNRKEYKTKQDIRNTAKAEWSKNWQFSKKKNKNQLSRTQTVVEPKLLRNDAPLLYKFEIVGRINLHFKHTFIQFGNLYMSLSTTLVKRIEYVEF